MLGMGCGPSSKQRSAGCAESFSLQVVSGFSGNKTSPTRHTQTYPQSKTFKNRGHLGCCPGLRPEARTNGVTTTTGSTMKRSNLIPTDAPAVDCSSKNPSYTKSSVRTASTSAAEDGLDRPIVSGRMWNGSNKAGERTQDTPMSVMGRNGNRPGGSHRRAGDCRNSIADQTPGLSLKLLRADTSNRYTMRSLVSKTILCYKRYAT
jgi:hypothetical protein